MKNIFRMVKEFNDNIIKLESNTSLSLDRFLWFKRVANEEITELLAAINHYTNPFYNQRLARVDMLDALVDLTYFVIGRVQELGFTEDEFYTHFKYVHEANMQKQKGNKGRGSDIDAIKPQTWIGPETRMLKYMSKKEAGKKHDK